MQTVVILRALELSASKMSLSWLVFWWLTCVSVLFYFFFFFFFLFIFFLVLYLDFFECFSILIFSYWVYLLILSYAQSVSFTCFQSMSTFTPFVCSITPSAVLFFSYAVPQFAYSDTKISCLVLLN